MKEKGITLIALIVTIIVLIILAGITIATLTGEDGIINNANNAKEETEIANEKEIVDRATINAMGNNKRGNIVEDELQYELDAITEKDLTDVLKNVHDLVVYFRKTDRYYNVDEEGNVTGPIEISKVEDEYPGDITKDEKGKELTGTIDEPYQINCIEDLCALSNAVNSGENYLGHYIELTTNLDFLSVFSYISGEIAMDGEIKSKATIYELMSELTQDKGFIPIGNNNYYFQGDFLGNGYKISNLFINSKNNYVGFFGYNNSYSGKIENLKLEDVDIKGNNYVGGVISYIKGYFSVLNCSVSGSINGNDNVGGIVGWLGGGVLEKNINYAMVSGNAYVGGVYGNIWRSASNNENYGSVNGVTEVGGIVGRLSSGIIERSFNYGVIRGDSKVGGVAGRMYYNNGVVVKNCYNTGKIEGETNVGGIAGSIEIWNGEGGELYYSYNIGMISANSNVGAIVGLNGGTVKNCYYLQGTYNGGINGNDIENQAETKSEVFMKGDGMVELLNNLNNSIIWKKDVENINDGYPIFMNEEA